MLTKNCNTWSVLEVAAGYRGVVREAAIIVVAVATTQWRWFIYLINIHSVPTRYLGIFMNKRGKNCPFGACILVRGDRKVQVISKLYSILEGCKY